jgi:hypothetical protein
MFEMNRMRALLVGAALATVAAVAPAAQASASPASPMNAPERCQSGYFCAYTQTKGNGGICSFAGNSDDMDGVGGCENKEGSVYNNGINDPGYNNVAMYFKPGQAGCWAALGLGDYYLDLHQNTFNHGTGGNSNGCGQSLWYNIASMRWY